jgi:hypothetical protein
MPVSLNKIASNTATVILWFGDDSLEIAYFPLRITTEMMATMASFADMKTEQAVVDNFRAVADMLATIIKSWDLLEDNGEPIPLTAERIVKISPVIALMVIQAILKDIRPEEIAPQQLPKNGQS